MGGDGDGIKTISEAVDEAATAAVELSKTQPDPRLAPPYHAFGKHVRSIWRMLKQGGVYLLLSTAPPDSRVHKIKTVGHGLKSSMEMWQKSVHLKLNKLGSRVLNTLKPEDTYHWAYIFVKSARRDVLKVGGSGGSGGSGAMGAPSAVAVPMDLGLPEDESSDDSSEGDLIDSNDESDGEEEEIVSDVEESQASEM